MSTFLLKDALFHLRSHGELKRANVYAGACSIPRALCPARAFWPTLLPCSYYLCVLKLYACIQA